MASNAVPTELISRVVGYKITKGDFSNSTPNLPQRIAIIGQANTANQAGLDIYPQEITSAQQAGEIFGYGSPIHMAMRILRPVNGGGVAGIPTIVYPQLEEVGHTAHEIDLGVTGTATANVVHTVQIAGRNGLDGQSYNVNISVGDTAAIILAKIKDVVLGVLGCPINVLNITSTVISFGSKWKGDTASDIEVVVETNGNSAGITYSTTVVTFGSGTSSTLLASLQLFGNDWNTIVVSTYGSDLTDVMDILEDYNGVPDPVTPTGRFQAILMKPFIALTGSRDDDPSGITNSRKDEVTIAICPMPGSLALPLEGAANMAVLFARVAQDTPHRDVNAMYYPDLPVATDPILMNQYLERDRMVKKGCSTVDINNGKYRVQDFVTTYHPTGEPVPQFRYCRNLMLDFNIRFGYYLLEQLHVVDKTIAENNEPVAVTGVIKPKGWKGILFTYADDLVARALIVDASFMQDSLIVNISPTNPDRLETFFRYKRSGVARISSTTAEAGFNFGTL